jgi:hypothetical protein
MHCALQITINVELFDVLCMLRPRRRLQFCLGVGQSNYITLGHQKQAVMGSREPRAYNNIQPTSR